MLKTSVLLRVSLSLCSLNVKGIRLSLKRKAIFLFCKKFQAEFHFIQETHALVSEYQFWKNQWGNEIWITYGSNRSLGVAILKGNFRGKILENKSNVFGRWVILVAEITDTILILGNIYGIKIAEEKKSCSNNLRRTSPHS